MFILSKSFVTFIKFYLLFLPNLPIEKMINENMIE